MPCSARKAGSVTTSSRDAAASALIVRAPRLPIALDSFSIADTSPERGAHRGPSRGMGIREHHRQEIGDALVDAKRCLASAWQILDGTEVRPPASNPR
jgi:hypothetical protein